MKKTFLVLCCILSISFSMISCSKEKKSDETPLTVWVYDNGRIDVLTEIGKQFEQEFGVPVEISLVDLGQIRTQFLLASGGAECADLAIIPHDNLGSLVENGAVQIINFGSKKSEFIEPALQGFFYNGQYYGVPLAVENIGFFYNTDMVAEPPKTWAEVEKIGKELVDSGKAEVIFGCCDATYNVYPVYSSFGGEIFGKKADGSLDPQKIEIANEGFVKGLSFLAKLAQEGYIPKTVDDNTAHAMFESGKAPFVMTGPWALNRYKVSGVKYEITSFPAATEGGEQGAPFLGVQGIVVSSSSKKSLLAQTFALDYIATEENMKKIFEAEARPSAWKTIFENSTDKDTAGFNKAGSNAIPMPAIPEMGYVWDSWVNAGALAFSGEKTASEALANAKLQIETQINSSK